MSKVKIPLKWYADLIHIPNTDNEYVLVEWFEDEKCTTKTLCCLGKYTKVTQYQINEPNLKEYSNTELTLKLINNQLNFIKLGEYTVENTLYFPQTYEVVKKGNIFKEVKE